LTHIHVDTPTLTKHAHATPHQIPGLLRHLAGLPPIPERAGQAPGQPEPIVDRLQQNGAAFGTDLRLVEPGDDRLRNPVDPEGAVRYTGCGHRASLTSCDESSCQRSFRTLQRLDGSLLSSFTHNPG